jgi:hypothetical protein
MAHTALHIHVVSSSAAGDYHAPECRTQVKHHIESGRGASFLRSTQIVSSGFVRRFWLVLHVCSRFVLGGIPEHPVTGSAHAVLAYHNSKLQKTVLKAVQRSSRTGKVHTRSRSGSSKSWVCCDRVCRNTFFFFFCLPSQHSVTSSLCDVLWPPKLFQNLQCEMCKLACWQSRFMSRLRVHSTKNARWLPPCCISHHGHRNAAR